MPSPNPDLHGSAPDKSSVVLLLIDVINALDFPEAEQMLPAALAAARRLAALKAQCATLGIPSVYVNDNFGRWRSDFRAYVDHCLSHDVLGRPLVELLRPDEDDYFVLKPKHSGFYSTTLEVLLEYLEAEALILTGIAGNICVLFTANDAYLRDFRLLVPRDCVASNTSAENEHALAQMRDILKADTIASNELDLRQLLADHRGRPGQ